MRGTLFDDYSILQSEVLMGLLKIWIFLKPTIHLSSNAMYNKCDNFHIVLEFSFEVFYL